MQPTSTDARRQGDAAFRVLEEIGPVCRGQRRPGDVAWQPAYAKPSGDGLLLIDRLSKDVLKIAAGGCRVSLRFSDRYGIRLEDPIAAFEIGGLLLVVERDANVIYAASSDLCRRVDVHGVLGRIVAAEPIDDSFYCLLTVGPNRIYILSLAGEVVHMVSLAGLELPYPRGISPTARRSMLICDPEINNVLELDLDGTVIWEYASVRSDLGEGLDLLCPPHAVEGADGRLYIADKYNNRVIGLGTSRRRVAFIYGERKNEEPMANVLSLPRYLALQPDGSLLICDYGNARIVAISDTGQTIRRYGRAAVRYWHLGFPRGLARHGNTCYVADSFRNRVYAFSHNRNIRCLHAPDASGGTGLFWPRAVGASGVVLVGDYRNGRIVKIDRGRASAVLDHYTLEGTSTRFSTVTDFQLLDQDRFLVLDGQAGLAVIVSTSGRAEWVYRDLRDPHSAEQLPNGNVLIADSGNKRVVEVDMHRQVVWECDRERLRSLVQAKQFHPKHATTLSDGSGIVIVDSRAGTVFCIDRAFNFRWCIASGTLTNTRLPYLDGPRWFLELSPEVFLISDYNNRRVLKVGKIPRHDPR